MYIAIYLPIFLIGVIVGSFLNVVIYRYNTGRSVVSGRSACFSCARTLRWFELVPLFSFLFQRGRCRQCLSKISWQYPAVELVSGLLFVLVFQHFLGVTLGKPLFILGATIWSLLLVITVYDLRHKIIPDGLVYAFSIFALVLVYLGPDRIDFFSHFWAGLIAFGFFFLLWWLSAGRWMGFGDAKLALGVGFLLGPIGTFSAIILAFWSGALVGVGLMFGSQLWSRGKSVTMKSEIPFAPFIVLGLFLNFFFHIYVSSFF